LGTDQSSVSRLV